VVFKTSPFFFSSLSAYLPTFEDPMVAMWRIRPDHIAGDFGFDPLGFSKRVDLRDEELVIGRIAMLAIAIMVIQELSAKVSIFLWWTERAFVMTPHPNIIIHIINNK
jgi:hypothetical protein